MRYYPINLDVRGKPCVVVGGGRVAERKVERLLAAGADVTVIAPELTPRLARWAEVDLIEHEATAYDEDSLEGAFLVIGATDDEAVNAQVRSDCDEHHALCNIVDDPEKCSFTLPALVERGELVIAVSTGGLSPAVAKRVRLELEKAYGQEYADFVALMGAVRDRLLYSGNGATEGAREKFERLAASDLPLLLKDGDNAAADALLAQVLGEGFTVDELIGAGPAAEAMPEENPPE